MALAFEKACRSAGLAVKIVPVPRHISASCGLACSFPCDEEKSVRKIISDKRIEVEDYHRLAN